MAYADAITPSTGEQMGMKFTYTVEVEVERVEGKFASRDDLGSQIQEWLEGADEESVYGEYDGQYDVVNFTVDQVEA